MGTTIILILSAVIVTAVFVILIIYRMKAARFAKQHRENQRSEKRQKTAVWASARVAEAVGGAVGDTARMTLTLEVSPPDGAPYRATSIWLVELSALSFVRMGSEVSVKIDADDPARIYPAVAWARYIGGQK